mgnify:CR=1 FL=1
MSFLDEKIESLEVADETLSNEEFAALTGKIEVLRKRIEAGEQVSLEEARLIVVWFRARRKKNFTVQKEKPVKEKVAATGKRRTKKVISEEEQANMLKNLLDSL